MSELPPECGNCKYFERLIHTKAPGSNAPFGICTWFEHNLRYVKLPWWSHINTSYGSIHPGQEGCKTFKAGEDKQ